jgi:hypothetical protein
MKRSKRFDVGDYVEVRSKEEILATLDKSGRLANLPFMPEMLEFCGQRFRVSKRAHKTCDPPNGMHGRRLADAVHLDQLRCSGNAHGGCEAGCLLFWKTAWLRRVETGEMQPPTSPSATARPEGGGQCSEEEVVAATLRRAEDGDASEPAYVCQSTEVRAATEPLHWWDVRQYVEDYGSGNVHVSRMVASSCASVFHEIATAGLGLGSAVRWIYDLFQRARGGTPYPWRRGRLARGTRTPSSSLNLQPGQMVRVKNYDEILGTLDASGHNRGMAFDAEMVPYCGGTYRVLKRVTKIINERTGRMQLLKNDCVVLQDVVCHACYARHRKFCPRAIFAYWREVWLERAE